MSAFEFKSHTDGKWYPLESQAVIYAMGKEGYEVRLTQAFDEERAMFDKWFFGKGVSDYGTKMNMWCAWWARALLTVRKKEDSSDA